jgi:hypothetical protein
MLRLAVDAISGHYTVPGPTMAGAGGRVASYPIAPPSTMRGFLESFCGLSYGRFSDLVFDYGYRAAPGGHGYVLRRCTVWTTATPEVLGETLRPLNFETYCWLRYWVQVQDGYEEQLLRRALRGAVPRGIGGPLFLGESSDLVTSISEVQEIVDEGGGCRVQPGRQLVMPWISGRGFGVRDAILRGWDLVPL